MQNRGPINHYFCGTWKKMVLVRKSNSLFQKIISTLVGWLFGIGSPSKDFNFDEKKKLTTLAMETTIPELKSVYLSLIPKIEYQEATASREFESALEDVSSERSYPPWNLPSYSARGEALSRSTILGDIGRVNDHWNGGSGFILVMHTTEKHKLMHLSLWN